MSRRRSFKNDLTLWSAGIFFVLYVAASCAILALEATHARQQLNSTLSNQAETLASYYAASNRMDYPELRLLEKELPITVWLRIVGHGRVLAATPNSPAFPAGAGDGEELRLQEMAGMEPLAVVRHPVWTQPGLFVEAFASTAPLRQRLRNLAVILALAGLLLVPLAALGGRILAARALRPIKDMVASVRALDTSHLEERLAVPSARELADLGREFNDLLSRLEESVNRMRRFTADASHELRTPVSILRTGLEVALRRERSVEEYRELLRENLLEIDRIQRIVEGLLTLAREEAQGGARAPALPVDLAGVVESAMQTVSPLATQNAVVLTSHIERPVQVLGDSDRLRLAVLNLLDNAVKYTPPGRSVEIALERRQEEARLVVADQGKGVPAGERPFIFDRFFRGQGARGASSGGLGLSVVRWVVESHGGRVQLLDAKGPGATFEVRLPLLDLSASAAAPFILHS
ncbi:MAG TPA: ATP-binding protein [Thermoanaerobaculia bacterium]|jgi:heavy metal sensor kinase